MKLHRLGVHAGAQLVQRLAGGELAALLHGALDQLARLQRVVGLLDGVVGDAFLADVEDGVEGVGHAAKAGALFAGKHDVLLIR